MAYFTKYSSLYRLSPEISLIFNTLTGAKDLIDEPTRIVIDQLMNGNTNCDCPSELREQLEKRGYLFESEEKEREQMEQMHETTKKINEQSKIPNYIICPTMGCNLRCTYCFESNDLHENCGVMTEEQLESILSMIKESYQLAKEKTAENDEREQPELEKPEDEGCEGENCEDQNCKKCEGQRPQFAGGLMLFGGEPLLPTNRKIVERVFEFANEWNFLVDIVSNGTNIAYYADILRENAQRTKIQITLDGDKEIHDTRRIRADGSGTFDKVCEGVTDALKLGVRVSLRVNVDKDNLHRLPGLTEVFKEHHWMDYPNFAPYLSPVECYEESGSDNTVTDADILKYVYEAGLYGNEHPSFFNVGPTTGLIENFFDNRPETNMWNVSFCGAAIGKNLLFTPNGSIYPCLTFCGNDKYVIGSYRDGKMTMNEHHDVWKNRDPFVLKNCKDCKYLLLCSGGCPARPNADADDCGVKHTMDRVIDLYVDHNRENFLKAMAEKAKAGEKKKEQEA